MEKNTQYLLGGAAVVAVGAYVLWSRKSGTAGAEADARASWADAPMLKAAAALPLKQYNDYLAEPLPDTFFAVDLSTSPFSPRTLPKGYTVIVSAQENKEWLASGGSGSIFYDPSKPGQSVRIWYAKPL